MRFPRDGNTPSKVLGASAYAESSSRSTGSDANLCHSRMSTATLTISSANYHPNQLPDEEAEDLEDEPNGLRR